MAAPTFRDLVAREGDACAAAWVVLVVVVRSLPASISLPLLRTRSLADDREKIQELRDIAEHRRKLEMDRALQRIRVT